MKTNIYFYSLLCCLLFSTSLHAEYYDDRSYNIYETYCTLLRDGYAHDLDREQKYKLFAGWDHDWVIFNQVKYSKLPEKDIRELLSEMYGELIDAKLNSLIKDSLSVWVKQGEFEKQSEYQNRLNQNFRFFFEKYCKELFQPYAFRITPLQYDIDNEKYLIELDYNLPEYYNIVNIISGFPYGKASGLSPSFATKTSSDVFTIKMSTEDAKYLKENWLQIKVFDVIFGKREFSVVPASFSFMINNKKYDVQNYNLHDFEVYAANLDLNIGSLKDLKYNYTMYEKQLISQKAQMLKEIEQANVPAEIEKFKKSQYYLQLTTDQQKEILLPYQNPPISITDDALEIEKFYNLLIDKGIYETLKGKVHEINPNSFALGYLAEYPNIEDSIKLAYQDYKCHYTYTDFIIDYIAGTLDTLKNNCRNRAWQLYGMYYTSYDNFNEDYSNGVDIQELINTIHFISQTLESNHKILIANEWKSLPVSTMKLNNADNPYAPQPIKDITQKYTSLNKYPFLQEAAAETIIRKNYYAKGEYNKNGSNFSSKREFVSAYFSAEYKTILKEMKKNKK